MYENKCPRCHSRRIKKLGKIRKKDKIELGFECLDCHRVFERDIWFKDHPPVDKNKHYT